MTDEEGPTTGASKFNTPHLTSIDETPVISEKLFSNPFQKLEHGLKGIEWHMFYFDFYASCHQLKNLVSEHLESSSYLKDVPTNVITDFNNIYEGEEGTGGTVKFIYRDSTTKKIPFASTLTVTQLNPITRSQANTIKVGSIAAQLYMCPYYADPGCEFKNSLDSCKECKHSSSYPHFVETKFVNSLTPSTHRVLTNMLKVQVKPSFGRLHSYLSQAVMNKKGGLPWIRGDLRQFGEDRPQWDIRHYLGYFVVGNKGSGKTTLLENGGCYYYDNGFMIFDMLGSDVGHENLFWCLKGSGEKARRYEMSLIHPEYVDVTVPDNFRKYVNTYVDDKQPLEKIIDEALAQKRVICFDNTSYDPDHYRSVLAGYFEDLLQLTEKTMAQKCILIREASKLMPGAQTTDSDDAQQSKTAAYYFFQEARHAMTTYIADLQRHSGLFKSARDLMQNLLVKTSNEDIMPDSVASVHNDIMSYHMRSASEGIPGYIYQQKYPGLNALDRMRGKNNKSRYYQFYTDEMFTLRNNPMPYFRHCGEHDNFSELTGIKFNVDYKLRKKVLSKKIKFDYDKWSERVVEGIKAGYTLPKDLIQEIGWDDEFTKFLSVLDQFKKMGLIAGGSKASPQLYIYEDDIERLQQDKVDKSAKQQNLKILAMDRMQEAKVLDKDLKRAKAAILRHLRSKVKDLNELKQIKDKIEELFPESA